ncbi:MAG TPA: methyltransferase domain-containing protein, partial [Phycisphaerales bacterium]|nr:methyltransferase domain-containing protein [Phycisphaerales bacterium]
DEALRLLRFLNRRLGGHAASLGHLARWSARWPSGARVTLVDLGTGSADFPIAARRWALARGFELRVTGVDLHPVTLDLARAHVARFPREAEGIDLVHAEAGELVERFGAGSFDYAHAALFLHHLPPLRVLTVLRVMDRLARRGVIWNDLVRSRAALTLAHLAVLGRPAHVRHDALVSVRAGFTPAEALDIARRVGLGACRLSRHLLHRFTVACEKPGGWEAPGRAGTCAP